MTEQSGALRPIAVLRARGHPSVRATHAKTVELTAAPAITARATCVVGVAAELPAPGLDGVRGPVVVTLRAGGVSERVVAHANPRYADPRRLVLRRSGHRSADTFATGADKAAADLDRRLVAALTDPGAELLVEVAAAEAPSLSFAEVVVWCQSPSGRGEEAAGRGLGRVSLALEAEPSGPRARGGAAVPQRGAMPGGGPPVVRGAEGRRRAWERLQRGEAVAILGDPSDDEDAAGLLAEAVGAGVPVRAEGEADRRVRALIEAGLAPARCALLGPPSSRRRERERQLAVVAELGVPAVWEATAARLAALLDDVAAQWPAAEVAVALSAAGAEEIRARGRADALAADGALTTVSGRLGGTLVVDPGLRVGAGAEESLRPLVRALLRSGVGARTLADALAELPGVTRRRAYRLVLDVRDGEPDAPAAAERE